MHLFSNVKYDLAGQEIESVNNQGDAGVLMGIAKYPYDYAYGTGMIQCCSPETSDGVLRERAFARRKEYIIEKSDPTARSVLQSSWRICLDSAKIMTRRDMACDTNSLLYEKVMMMLSSRLRLLLKAWVMPRVHPNYVKKFSLYKSIESKIVLDAALRMRQCSIAEIPAQTRTFDWRLGENNTVQHPPLYFNNAQVHKKKKHKHLGLLLDTKLSFLEHINEKINKTYKIIGTLRFLSKYLPLHSLIRFIR